MSPRKLRFTAADPRGHPNCNGLAIERGHPNEQQSESEPKPEPEQGSEPEPEPEQGSEPEPERGAPRGAPRRAPRRAEVAPRRVLSAATAGVRRVCPPAVARRISKRSQTKKCRGLRPLPNA